MKREEEFYSNAYKDKLLSKSEQKRIKLFLSKIPVCNRVLELGCADGRILDRIKADYKIGIDFVIKPLKNVKSRVYASNISYLPFDDNSFDLVISSEVLEHLDAKTFYKALEEINRVSSKYIMISVPYREQLIQLLAWCSNCKKYYHAFLHKRSFSDNDFVEMFPDFKIIKSFKYGITSNIPKFLLKIKFITKSYFIGKSGICPYCGVAKNSKKLNLFNKTFNYFLSFLRIFISFKKTPKWIIVIYINKDINHSFKHSNVKNILVCPKCHEKIIIQNQVAVCSNNHSFYFNEDILDFRI
ncbi:MAG: class I SAM-dependent methyltransferase [Promethearchaeota archaeon]